MEAGPSLAEAGSGMNQSMYSIPFGNAMRMSIFILAYDTGEARKRYACAPLGSSGKETALLNLRACLDRLYTWLGPDYDRKRKGSRPMRDRVNKGSYEDLVAAETEIIAYLYDDMKLFKYANRKDYDTTRVELENKDHGL